MKVERKTYEVAMASIEERGWFVSNNAGKVSINKMHQGPFNSMALRFDLAESEAQDLAELLQVVLK